MQRLLYAGFDFLESCITRVTDTVQGWWRRFRDGALQSILFWLILTISAIIVLVTAALEELDRLLAWLEKAFISIAMLVMVGLYFLAYLRREWEFFDFEINGGPTMAVVLMVWVGFLGASLATRQRKHLAVDATDRILSPKAARMVKRFTALIAAGFCWIFTDHAVALMEDNLISGTGQDALPLWNWMIPGVNVLGQLVLSGSSNIVPLLCCAGLLAGIAYVMRIWRALENPALPVLESAGAIVLLVGGLLFIGQQWNPVHEDGEPYAWHNIGAEVETGEETAQADLLSLIGDTGSGSADDEELQAFLSDNTGSEEFPMWLAQAVIPLSFLLMSFRFLGLGLSGRFEGDEEETDKDIEHAPPPPPPTKLIRSTGRGARDLIFAGLFPGILIGMGVTLGFKLGTLILFGAILLVLVGAPLFLAIGVASLACVTLIQDISALNIAKDMYEAVKKEELLAIPFFVLAGNLMTKGTIAERLVGVARAFMGRLPGGLGLASVFACVVFAAISGSSPVTVIAVGTIMFPMLMKERYPENYSLGVLTSAGSLGIIIPPSVPMIVYAIVVSQTLLAVGKGMIDPATNLLPGGWDPVVLQVSPNDLFIAGVLPGLFIASILGLYTLYQTRPTRKDIDIVEVKLEGGYASNLFGELRKSWLSLMLPVIVLGGIYGVLGPLRFTVTEAAAVAVVYALFVELFIHREMKPKDLPKVLSESGVMMGGLFLIIVLAIAFNKFLAEQYIPQNAAAWIQSQVNEPWQFLILVNIFLLALGCVMDIISAILIVAPLLAPIAMSYGIHPLHFGIMFIVNLELGYLTPPLGINLFVSSTVFNRPVVQVIKATIPFLLLMLFCLIVIVWFPSLSLLLVGS